MLPASWGDTCIQWAHFREHPFKIAFDLQSRTLMKTAAEASRLRDDFFGCLKRLIYPECRRSEGSGTYLVECFRESAQRLQQI